MCIRDSYQRASELACNRGAHSGVKNESCSDCHETCASASGLVGNVDCANFRPQLQVDFRRRRSVRSLYQRASELACNRGAHSGVKNESCSDLLETCASASALVGNVDRANFSPQLRVEVGRRRPVRSLYQRCLLYTSPSPRDLSTSRMPSSA